MQQALQCIANVELVKLLPRVTRGQREQAIGRRGSIKLPYRARFQSREMIVVVFAIDYTVEMQLRWSAGGRRDPTGPFTRQGTHVIRHGV